VRRAAAVALALGTAAAAGSAPAAAQPRDSLPRDSLPRDSLRLADLHAAAAARDARARQPELQAAQSALRLRSLDAERLPALVGEGQAQYQSHVARVPLSLPGVRVPTPAHDTYDAHVGARLSLLDPTRAPRRAAERASLAESQSQVRAALFALRAEVDEAFFAAAALDARGAELRAAIAGLDARRREAAVRVRGGAALPSDTAAIAATLLQRRQDVAQVDAERRAALARLAQLAGAPADAAPIALPDLAAPFARARAALDSLRLRPEFAQFAAARERLARQAEVDRARERPRVSAFARAGYGRPGLNPLATTFDAYWLGGVQVQWTPWTWGTNARDREILALQAEVVAASESAFAAQLRRAVESDVAAADRLAESLALDDAIVALRESVERETRARLREGVVTAAEYADRETELLAARLARASRRVALTQARARALTTLGVEIPR
jgi:outer membrane protein TolC